MFPRPSSVCIAFYPCALPIFHSEAKWASFANSAVQKGYRPCLFLEEIDKVSYTTFKTDCLFELFYAINENKGQLVFNSNMTPVEFKEQFGPKDGPAIIGHIAETFNVFNFFEK